MGHNLYSIGPTLQMCESRLKNVPNPSTYYHSVCRALLDMALLIMKAKVCFDVCGVCVMCVVCV